jgi:hypothetical protein
MFRPSVPLAIKKLKSNSLVSDSAFQCSDKDLYVAFRICKLLLQRKYTIKIGWKKKHTIKTNFKVHKNKLSSKREIKTTKKIALYCNNSQWHPWDQGIS